MRLALFRHGLAMEREEALARKIDESLRPLVEKGRQRTQKMAELMAEKEKKFQVLLFSPFLRCRQTAEVLRQGMTFQQSFELSELVPESPPQALAQWLQISIPQATSVLVVGHEPQLSVFASWCLTGESQSFIDLKKSGVIGLEVESFDHLGPQTAELRYLLQPRFLS